MEHTLQASINQKGPGYLLFWFPDDVLIYRFGGIDDKSQNKASVCI